jgi:hypothetical protein
MSFWLNVRRNNPEPLMSESGHSRHSRYPGVSGSLQLNRESALSAREDRLVAAWYRSSH